MKDIRYVPIISIIIGLYWFYMGFFNYGFWAKITPGAGFLPSIVGVMLVGFSIWILFTPVVKKGSLQIRAFYPAFAALLCLISIYILGLMVTITLFVILWLILIEKLTIKKAGIIGACTIVFIHFVFKVWLMVPFPKGFLGI